jgi:hypothetical protein
LDPELPVPTQPFGYPETLIFTLFPTNFCFSHFGMSHLVGLSPILLEQEGLPQHKSSNMLPSPKIETSFVMLQFGPRFTTYTRKLNHGPTIWDKKGVPLGTSKGLDWELGEH